MTKEEIIELIEDEDVGFIRLQFTDIFGILKNIAVTPGQMAKVFSNKYSFEGSAIFGDRYKYDGKLYLYPDLDSFLILPWRPQQGKVAKLMCDVCYEDGTPFTMSSRYILKNVLEKAKKLGYTFMIDPECEFFLFHTDENGIPTTTTHDKAGYLDVGPIDFGENARREIVLILEEMGFEIKASHHEHAPAQHEIDFGEAEAMDMADAIQNFKFAVRSVAKRFGLYATFMPKPRGDVAGSGMHINIRALKDGKNIFKQDGAGLTKDADAFIGGILKHAKALCGITNQIVNSYKRLMSGFDAPKDITWSYSGEQALVKFNKTMDDAKVELRSPDGAANPYLLLASVIAAGLDGIENGYSAGDDISKIDATVTKVESLPENLKDAMEILQKDELIRNTLGEEFINVYITIKLNEWKDYMTQVSSWELDRYLHKV